MTVYRLNIQNKVESHDMLQSTLDIHIDPARSAFQTTSSISPIHVDVHMEKPFPLDFNRFRLQTIYPTTRT